MGGNTRLAPAFAFLALIGCGSEDGDDPPKRTQEALRYHQWSYPEGGEAAARGVVITLHGGSWTLTGERAAMRMEPVARALNAQGYAVLNGTYLRGREGIRSIEALYSLAKKRAGNRGLCVYGESAGGSWALELAIRHPDLRCVIAEAPPTDLRALAEAAPRAERFLTRIFGTDLRAYSPIRGPFSRSTDILIAGVTTDRVVPWSQARRFRAKWPQTRLLPLRPGNSRWVHAFASASSVRRFEKARSLVLKKALR